MFIKIVNEKHTPATIENFDSEIRIFFSDKTRQDCDLGPDLIIEEVGTLGGERGAIIRLGGSIGTSSIKLIDSSSFKAVIKR